MGWSIITASLTFFFLLLTLPLMLVTTLPSLDTLLCSSCSNKGDEGGGGEGIGGASNLEEPIMAISCLVRGTPSSTGGAGEEEIEGWSQEAASVLCWGWQLTWPIENFCTSSNEKDMKTKIMRAHRVKSQIEQVQAWQ